MTPAQIRLLQQSFANLRAVSVEAGQDFYVKLFELAPQTKVIFEPDEDLHWHSFMAVFEKLISIDLRSMLTVPITSSGNREISLPGVAGLAEIYAKRGVLPEHLAPARVALLWSLENRLPGRFDAETAKAWGEAFDIIAGSLTSIMRSEAVDPVLPHNRAGRQDIREYALSDHLFQN